MKVENRRYTTNPILRRDFTRGEIKSMHRMEKRLRVLAKQPGFAHELQDKAMLAWAVDQIDRLRAVVMNVRLVSSGAW